MSSLWTNLLFMHGHIADADLARRLAEMPQPSSRPSGKRQRRKSEPAARSCKPAAPALAAGGCG